MQAHYAVSGEEHYLLLERDIFAVCSVPGYDCERDARYVHLHRYLGKAVQIAASGHFELEKALFLRRDTENEVPVGPCILGTVDNEFVIDLEEHVNINGNVVLLERIVNVAYHSRSSADPVHCGRVHRELKDVGGISLELGTGDP